MNDPETQKTLDNLKVKVGVLIVLVAALAFGLLAHVVHDALAFSALANHLAETMK